MKKHLRQYIRWTLTKDATHHFHRWRFQGCRPFIGRSHGDIGQHQQVDHHEDAGGSRKFGGYPLPEDVQADEDSRGRDEAIWRSHGFSGERVGTQGYIELYTTFDKGKVSKTIKNWYLVINVNTSYNILLRRPSINRLRAIVSTSHLGMKFSPASRDILTVHVDQKLAWECYAKSLRVEPTRQDAYDSRSPKCKPPEDRGPLEEKLSWCAESTRSL